MLEKFRFKCPVCGLLGHGGMLLKKDVPDVYFKVHQSQGRGTLRTEKVAGKPEWRQALAARLYKVIEHLVAEGLLDAREVSRAASRGDSRRFIDKLSKLMQEIRKL